MRIAQCLGVVEINEISRLKSLHGPSDIPAPLNVISNLFILIFSLPFYLILSTLFFKCFFNIALILSGYILVFILVLLLISVLMFQYWYWCFNIGIDVSILVLMCPNCRRSVSSIFLWYALPLSHSVDHSIWAEMETNMFKVFLRTIKVILDFKYWELRGLPNLHNHRRLIGIWKM